jgi:ABC-type transport system involved in multi-copper enzyme maturation permease subunit
VLFVCVFSSFLQTLHVSRDIDSRTYESYLYGMVDEAAYINAFFLSYTAVNFLGIICFPLLWMFIVFLISGIQCGWAAVIQLLFGYCLSNLVLSIAMCIGALAKKSKFAIWYLLLFHLIGTGIVFGNTVISKYLIPLKRSDLDFFSFFRNISNFLYGASVYFSPYSQFFQMQKNFHYSPSFTIIIWLVIVVAQIVFVLISRYLFKRSIA